MNLCFCDGFFEKKLENLYKAEARQDAALRLPRDDPDAGQKEGQLNERHTTTPNARDAMDERVEGGEGRSL